MKAPKLALVKKDRRVGSDTAKLFWVAHLNAMRVIQNNLDALNANIVTAMARFDDINLADGWAWNADTQHWEQQGE